MVVFLIIPLILISLNYSHKNYSSYIEIIGGSGIMGGPQKEQDSEKTTLMFDAFYSSNQNQYTNQLAVSGLNSNQVENRILGQKNTFVNSNLSKFLDFILPTQGINWGKIHPQNAVDISSPCGTDVLSAESGLVIDLARSGWNGGYGKYIKIEHLNNTKTVYAHLSLINVSIGDYVKKGQKIGEVGQTGETTGCHLHFEVWGIENPFAKK